MSESADLIKTMIERIERLEEEKRGLSEDIRDVYAEAKAGGLDVKALRTIVRLRRISTADRHQQDAILETYMNAIGMV